MLAGRCAPNSAARPARTVVIFTGFSISIPAAGSRACSATPTRIALGIFWDAALGSDADLPAEVARRACSGTRYDLCSRKTEDLPDYPDLVIRVTMALPGRHHAQTISKKRQRTADIYGSARRQCLPDDVSHKKRNNQQGVHLCRQLSQFPGGKNPPGSNG